MVTLAATGLSLAALGWLAATDPKRRRAFGLPPHPGPRRTGATWTLALLPGVLVPLGSGGAGLTIWLGAVSVAGWGLAAVPPDRPAAWLAALRHRVPALALLRVPVTRLLRRTDVAALERRIAELEAQLVELRAERDARPSPGPIDRPHPLPH